VEEKEWWFFKDFTSPETSDGELVDLVFEGITYRSDVWLNGIAIGNTEGMFLRHEFDVTDVLRVDGTNRLALRVRALEGSSEDRPGGKVKRGTVRSSGVVAPFSYWWNWSPHLVPIGIWKSVFLRLTGGAVLRDPFVRAEIEWSEADEPRNALIRIGVDIESRFSAEKQVALNGRIAGVDFDGSEAEIDKVLVLRPGGNHVEVETSLAEPRLWWPNGLGDHPLYRLELDLRDSDCALHSVKSEFGVREVERIRNEDDEWVQAVSAQSNRLWSIVGKPYPWTFQVNRRRVFVRGSNWLPTDNLFRFSEERYRLFLDQAEAANINLLRVWGGGIQETETFYRLCDRKGIMTWAEFWFSCANYPAMPRDLFLRCARDMVRCLRNHPSLAIWCGGNEYNPDTRENKRLVDSIGEACGEEDPTRGFLRGSPYKGDRHGGLLMLPTRTSNKYNGDILNGDGRLTLFRAEVAVMRSAPLLDSIKRFMGEDKLWPIDRPAWQYHHAVIKEQERDAREYGGEDTLERWLMSGQIAHGQNHRHNMEYCRQTKYRCSGCMQWQLNGSWPTFHRELIDWYGVPKPAFYAYKRACADVIVIADMEKYVFDGNERFDLGIYAVSDLRKALGPCRVKARVFDLSGEVLHAQEGDAEIGPDESVHVFDLDWTIPPDFLRKVLFLHLELRNGERRLAENLYWTGTSAYSRSDESINLDGSWERWVGEETQAAEWEATDIPSYWHKPPIAPPEGSSVFYRRAVLIPSAWEGAELEVFCAGFEGNDEVFFNGAQIGATQEEVHIETGTDDALFTEKWVERMAQEEGEAPSKPSAQAEKSDLQNIRISSDPFIAPNLVKRFYPIPADRIRWGEDNDLEIRLYGEHATGISEPVFVRRRSTEEQRRAVIEFDNAAAYLADLANLPMIDLAVERMPALSGESEEFGAVSFRIGNDTAFVAFFVGLSLGETESNREPLFSDNYFSLLPGEAREVTAWIPDSGVDLSSAPLKLTVEGWNIKTSACISKESR